MDYFGNNIDYQPNKYFFISFVGIIFPYIKYISILYLIQNYRFSFVSYDKNFSLQVSVVFNNICNNYFWWQLCCIYLLPGSWKTDWFTLFSIFYNYFVYQTVILSHFSHSPLIGILFTSCLQYLDSVPLSVAILDNIISLYYFPFEFLPEKLLLYLVCMILNIYI